jgi:hypothetical protein
MPKDAQDEEAKVESPLYDLVGAELFLPFSIHFAGGQRFEINTREYIGLDPVSRTDVDASKSVIVRDQLRYRRSVNMAVILKVERSQS